jgi:hypothetical protein
MATNNNNNDNNNRGLQRAMILGQDGPPLIASVPDAAAFAVDVGTLRSEWRERVNGDRVRAPQLDNPAWVRAAVNWYDAATAFQQQYGGHNVPSDIANAMADLRESLPNGTLP